MEPFPEPRFQSLMYPHPTTLLPASGVDDGDEGEDTVSSPYGSTTSDNSDLAFVFVGNYLNNRTKDHRHGGGGHSDSPTDIFSSTLSTLWSSSNGSLYENGSRGMEESEGSWWSGDEGDDVYRHSRTINFILIVAYMLILTIGVVGNCLVVAVVIRTPRMRTVTNLFILNLAVADLLVILFCLPPTLLSNLLVRKLSHSPPAFRLVVLISLVGFPDAFHDFPVLQPITVND
jgi:hypothetical protein